MVGQYLNDAHLSTGLSDLKRNGTQANVSFSGTVFQDFSCGVIPFLPSVSSNSNSKKDHTEFRNVRLEDSEQGGLS